MNKEIILITGIPFGYRQGLRGFDTSKKFIPKLRKVLEENGLDFVIRKDNLLDLDNLENKNIALVLISPYIKKIVDTSKLHESQYLILNEKEYLRFEMDRIITRLGGAI